MSFLDDAQWPEYRSGSLKALYIEMRFEGQYLASGTGFIVRTRTGPALITNRHNFTGRDNNTGQPLSKTGGVPSEVMILHHRWRELGYWVERVEALYQEGSDYVDGAYRWVEHPLYGERADVVALPLTQLDNVQLYPWIPGCPPNSSYRVAQEATFNPEFPNPGDGDIPIDVLPADEVSVIGFPFGQRMHWTANEVDARFPPGPLEKFNQLREEHRAVQDRFHLAFEERGLSRDESLPEAIDREFSSLFKEIAKRCKAIQREFGDIPSLKGGLPVWATGFVASEPQLDLGGKPVFLIDSRTRRGQSGSPVVACRNRGLVHLKGARHKTVESRTPAYRFMGVYSGRINPESDLGYVWKASAVRDLIEVMGGDPLPRRWPQEFFNTE